MSDATGADTPPDEAQESVEGAKARFPLGWKLAILTVLLTTIPLAGVGVALISINRDAVVNLNREVQLSVLDDLAHTVDQALVGAQDSLDMAGSFFTDDALDDAQRLALIRAEVQGTEALDHVGLYDVAGQRLAVIETVETSFELPETLPASMRTEIERLHHASGDVEVIGGSPRVLMAVRIRVDDRTTGYVASFVSLEEVQRRVERLAEGHFAGQENALFVADQQLRVIAHNDRERAVGLTSVADVGILAGISAEQLGPNYSQAGEFVDGDGTEMLGTSVGLEGQPWILVAQTPQAVAYASLTRMTYLVFATILLAMLLAILAGLFASARLVGVPLRELTRFALSLARRNWSDRAKVTTRDELSILGHAMNRAASDLEESEQALAAEVAIRTDLGRYVPEQLVDQIVRREQDMALGGSRREITVLFADVVGFTPMMDQLAPEHVVSILNELFTILTEIVFRHDGTVDKFIGDCVMAIWNAPVEQQDHVQQALDTAEEMLSWLETGNERWQEQYGVTIQLAVGVHTGEAVVGNVGSEKRMEYTAIGDVVNVAARLEAIARPQQVLVTDAVKRTVGDDYDFNDADLHRLSGRAEPIHLWELDT